VAAENLTGTLGAEATNFTWPKPQLAVLQTDGWCRAGSSRSNIGEAVDCPQASRANTGISFIGPVARHFGHATVHWFFSSFINSLSVE
jgi:hypothetical protein